MCPNFVFDDVDKAMFQIKARHWELIFFIVTTPKFDLGEVVKAMFQGLPCHFELIFSLLPIAKCLLIEVENSMFKCSFFQPLDQPKMRLGRIKKATFPIVARQ